MLLLHGQFYLEEAGCLSDWISVIDGADLVMTTTLTLKALDRIGS